MRLVSYAFVGVEPEVMGYGPIPATEKALAKAGLSIGDIGLFEINEAFAVQVLAFLDHYGIADDDARVNQYGGAIAFGHPLASSGCASDDAARPPVRGAAGGPLRPHHHVRRLRHGRHGHLGEPAPQGRRRRQVSTTELLKGAAELFPDEVVHVRARTPPRPAVRRRPFRADHPRQRLRPHQADHLRPGLAGEPDTAIDQVEKEATAGEIVGVGITGKPFIFAVGADLKGVELLKNHADALAIGKGGHEVFKRLPGSRSRPSATTTVPRWAVASRSVCTARTGPCRSPSPAFSLPEVFLGLVPGWGGCTILPNLIGADRAVTRDHRELAQPEQAAQGRSRSSTWASPTRCSRARTSWSSR